jgi:hypothetical protein
MPSAPLSVAISAAFAQDDRTPATQTKDLITNDVWL